MNVQESSVESFGLPQELEHVVLTAQPEPARITEIDINRAARTLAVLRLSDYVLVVVCGLGAVGSLSDFVVQAYSGHVTETGVALVMALVFGFAAFTGWRHVGVIDPRVWRSYVWVFPLLIGLAVFLALGMLPTVMTKGWDTFRDVDTLLTLWTALYFAGIAIPGFVCVLLLGRARVPSTGMTLKALLESLAARAGMAAPSLTHIPRANLSRGLVYGVAGVLVLLVTLFTPATMADGRPSVFLRMADQINLLAFFLFVRARRYFQVNADALLAVDKRAPILFLRSFADDERQQYGNSRRALLDFSLETRLANHFYHFGPFIAIGSPKETVPQPGAARVLLADDEWQGRVLGWMRDANLIIMYCGTTQWVNWELRRVVESGCATNLILMFPEIKTRRATLRKQDIAARVEQVRDAFRNTPWNEELVAFDDFEGLRAMLFRADGSMVMVKSRSRSRDAYHLAALIAHQQMLDTADAARIPVTRIEAPRRRRTKGIAAAAVAAGVALLGGLYLAVPGRGERLTFKQGELYYQAPVTKAQAKRVGDYLIQEQFFSDNRTVTVQLDRQQDIYRIRFVVDPAHMEDPLVALQFGRLVGDVSQRALAGAPIEVALCDAYLKPIKVLPRTAKLTFGMGELYYTAPVTSQEAQAVGKQLVELEYFNDERRSSVHLGRDGDAHQLRFVINTARISDPEILGAFVSLSRTIAENALSGQPVVVHLCEAEFQCMKSERVAPRADAVRMRRSSATQAR